ncbi:MAG: electron transport complex subunit RsxC [Clostridia bacterium]|nr:electron transport complex subunit RsxC [Clostridia bacterium]
MNEYKITASKPIEKLPVPETVVVPLSQHIGAPCTATVKVGDTVDKGQIIGVVEKGLGCPVHASVSGKVSKIETVITPSGRKVEQIVIENDGEERLLADIRHNGKSIEDITAEECIEAVRLAGISGMGGATFPTYAKISSALGKAKHIIINSAECEPFITANHRLMLEEPKKIIDGLKLLMRVFGIEKGVIAIEDNKMDAVEMLRKTLGDDTSVEVTVMKTKYPQGDERQIIYALTGVELKSGKLPADVGCVIFNSETCYNVYRAVFEGMPLIERIVTVSGNCVKEPKNILAPIGTSISKLIDFCGGFTEAPEKIVLGGPMMGFAQWDINVPVTKGTNAVLALSESFNKKASTPYACLHCGKCVSVCPMHLMPLYLAQHAQNKDFETCEKYNALSCVECGSCAYICPGNVPLVQLIRLAKGVINDKRRAQAAQAPKPEEKKEEKK